MEMKICHHVCLCYVHVIINMNAWLSGMTFPGALEVIKSGLYDKYSSCYCVPIGVWNTVLYLHWFWCHCNNIQGFKEVIRYKTPLEITREQKNKQTIGHYYLYFKHTLITLALDTGMSSWQWTPALMWEFLFNFFCSHCTFLYD